MTRRDFLQASAVAFVPTMLARQSFGMPAPIVAAIYDVRFAEAWAFADHLRWSGAIVYPSHGDASALWYGDFGKCFRKRGGRVAGLTAYPDLVIARSCGRELGLRLVTENREPGQTLTHWLLEPRSLGPC